MSQSHSRTASNGTQSLACFQDTIQQHLELIAGLTSLHPTLHVQPLSPHRLALHTSLRDQRTPAVQFAQVADQLLRQLVEFAIDALPMHSKTICTPTGAPYTGCSLADEIVGISILRAGESMEHALRMVLPGCRIGKLLIQRDETSPEKQAKFFYSKLPPGLVRPAVSATSAAASTSAPSTPPPTSTRLLLLDPMLASGTSAICALHHLLSVGVTIDRITFVCLIASPEGIAAVLKEFPTLTIIAGSVDPVLNEDKYIVPGVGDFGDRYFGTVDETTVHEQ